MTKRSLFLTVAAGLLASVAFATPSQAGSTTVTTTVSFNVTSPGTASDVEVTYTPGVDPVTLGTAPSGVTLTADPGGLANTVEAAFSPAASGTFSFTFTTATPGPITFSSASLTGVTAGSSGTVSVGVTASSGVVPEPGSMALLGIGMTGFLAFRRLFKRHAIA
jgi:hypothetical protein